MPSAVGGLTTYPMARRADPRVGRAGARATQGAAGVRAARFRAPVCSPAGRGTGGRTDCEPMKRIGPYDRRVDRGLQVTHSTGGLSLPRQPQDDVAPALAGAAALSDQIFRAVISCGNPGHEQPVPVFQHFARSDPSFLRSDSVFVEGGDLLRLGAVVQGRPPGDVAGLRGVERRQPGRARDRRRRNKLGDLLRGQGDAATACRPPPSTGATR